MQTDWVLIRRLADELKGRLRGARVDDAGLTADGRVAIAFRQRGERLLLAADLFASPPVVTLEQGELGIGVEPHFVRVLARSLRGMSLAGAASRRDDRLLRLEFASRSRFGVGEQLESYIELVPRFGNVVLVKDGIVVAALREFAPSENPRRPVQAGSPYSLPPLPPHPQRLVTQPEGSVLEYFASLRTAQSAKAGNQRLAQRRQSISKRLDERERKLHGELASLAAKRVLVEGRNALRSEGEAIFETLHDLPPADRDAAKERAADLFARYKKLAKSLPHAQARERTVRSSLEAVETLRWEAERASDEDLEAVETAVAELGPKRGAPAPASVPKRKRAPLEIRTAHGSRILVGRSPIENADLTFRIARPSDLWFHAQRIPGAHVILSRDDRAPAPSEDLELAASLAAFYSRAKNSAGVPVDYTLRKHVRKQRAAPPGLVWYTNAKTIVVEPQSLDSLQQPATEAAIRTPSSRD
jgi:predicted ribosome quality control (RQC) complex YloA/Tae2 family protein